MYKILIDRAFTLCMSRRDDDDYMGPPIIEVEFEKDILI